MTQRSPAAHPPLSCTIERLGPTDRRLERKRKRLELRGAIEGPALTIRYQPVVDIRTGRTVGCEALASFHTEPPRTPDLWFQDAWALGLGIEFEIEAIRRALAQLGDLPPETYLAVNASAETLRSPELAALLEGQPLERIVLEITEHDRVDDYDRLNEALGPLRTKGARLSIDDTGAGFSSLQHILRLQPDIIKLDRSLTTSIDTNPVRSALAAALVTFAASLGAHICAEGIETATELLALQKLGVAYGQGYLLARPGPLPLAPIPDGFWLSRRGWPPARAAVASPEVNSPKRLAAVKGTGLLDTPPEESFDRLTRLAAKILDVPVALVTLVDDRRQFFLSAAIVSGPLVGTRETPLTHSFCQHAVTMKLPLVIDDARVHPLGAAHGAVTDLGVVAYAGIPLVDAEGQALGALCAIDAKPRHWRVDEIALLSELAAMCVAHIELRRVAHAQLHYNSVIRRSFEQLGAAAILSRADGRIEHASTRLSALLGYEAGELTGVPVAALEHEEDAVRARAVHADLLRGATSATTFAVRLLKKDGASLDAELTSSVVRDATGRALFVMTSVGGGDEASRGGPGRFP